MKKMLFGLIATVMLSNYSFAQTSNVAWLSMIENYRASVDKVILTECPKDIELSKFKISLINGENKLSEKSQELITTYSEPLKKYGLEFAKKNNLEAVTDSDLIFYSSFSPDMPIKDGQLIGAKMGPGITWAEVGACALAALGADAAWAWAAGSGTSWSIAALTTTFTGVAKRFLGPIGVGIAVATFSYCLYQSY